ncbi:MAG TPA: YcaO-like family protein [Solirubrobacterales bacterium]|jgi:ribosomal protein S12 methylthiotransferase accessory factor|nr:YcaO-like family protein [Solirubrobacterales bacterium]
MTIPATGSAFVLSQLLSGELLAAPGVMVVRKDNGEILVLVTGGMLGVEARSIEDPGELLDLGLIVERGGQPGFTSAGVQDWNGGWSEALTAGKRFFVSLDRALDLSAEMDASARRKLILRFLAGLPPDQGSSLLEVLNGSSEVLSLMPTWQLLDRLREMRRTGSVPLLITAQHPPCSVETVTGPMSPALHITEREAKGQHMAFTAVLPSPSGIGLPPATAVGVKATSEEARLVATAEAYERYAAGVVAPSDVVVSSFADLEDAVPPNTVVAYASWQYRLHDDLMPFDAHEPRVWAWAAAGGRRRAVLADLVFYPFGSGGSMRHTDANSSGMAAQVTSSKAIDAAYLELVERDAFMRHWLATRPGRRVDISSPPDQYRTMHEDLASAGWHVYVLQLGESPTESVLCVVAERRKMLVLGAAAGDPFGAAVRAMSEVWASVRLSDAPEDVPEVDAVRSPSDHRKLYRWGGYAEEVEFLWEGDETVKIEDLMAAKPPTSIVYEWPTEYTQPFTVVRVIDPDLIPLTFGYQREPLGRADVAEMIVGRADVHHMIPHPFP